MPDNGKQLHARSYLLAVEDTEFLLRDELRAVRFALEYQKAELLLRDWGVRSTLIVFGSARVPSPEYAAAELKAAVGDEAIARATRRKELSRYYEEARLFGRIVSERGGAMKRSLAFGSGISHETAGFDRFSRHAIWIRAVSEE